MASNTTTTDSNRPVLEPTEKKKEFRKVVPPKGQMAKKHERASPYHIFYTTITDEEETHTQEYSIAFQEVLDSSLGELENSLQITFLLDIDWLLDHYNMAGYGEKKLTILYGAESDLQTIDQNRNVDAHMISTGGEFGMQHTKLMLLCYKDGTLRVVISTANLYFEDWDNKAQGLWMSPACPELPNTALSHTGESPTGFKKSLIGYLSQYKMHCLWYYIKRVRRCDFSNINVFLVASVPGECGDSSWGMSRVNALLSRHCEIPVLDQREWDLIVQSSSVGNYGKEASYWLTGKFQSRFCRVQNDSVEDRAALPELKFIYPSLECVRRAHGGMEKCSLPYVAVTHARQPWLNGFLHEWKAQSSKRDKALPHVKSYMRVSPDYKMAAYYLLTSANFSKGAWGTYDRGKPTLRIANYEAGVLFLPRFVLNQGYFPLDKDAKDALPVVYDLPPTRYTSTMVPWVMDYLDDESD